MPTHKLWIEHTERAAWQSVQALREKLAEAERQRRAHGAPRRGLAGALRRARRCARESRALGRDVCRPHRCGARAPDARRSRAACARGASCWGSRSAPSPEPEPLPRRLQRTGGVVANDDEELAAGRPNRSERQFFREIRQRDRELGKERPRPDPELELGDIERRLADLPEVDPAEIMDIAADLAALALHLRPARDLDDD